MSIKWFYVNIVKLAVLAFGFFSFAWGADGIEPPIVEGAACFLSKPELLRLTGTDFNADRKIEDLNTSIEKWHPIYFCQDQRTFYSLVRNKMEKMGLNPIFKAYLEAHHLNSPDSERTTDGDKVRMRKFRKIYEEAADLMVGPSTPIATFNWVILLAGWANELYPEEYFRDLRESLMSDFKLKRNQIYQIGTNTFGSSIRDIKRVQMTVAKIKRLDAKARILIVGHSKGGLIGLETLLTYPNLILDPAVVRLVTIQSPLKGTPLVDPFNFACSAEKTLKSMLSFDSTCPLFDAVEQGSESMNSSMTHKEVGARIAELKAPYRISLSKKLYYITSAFKDGQQPPVTKFGRWLMNERSDGTVPYSSQFIRSVGRRLGHFNNIDHTDFIIDDSYMSYLSKQQRRHFARALILSVDSPNLEYESF